MPKKTRPSKNLGKSTSFIFYQKRLKKAEKSFTSGERS